MFFTRKSRSVVGGKSRKVYAAPPSGDEGSGEEFRLQRDIKDLAWNHVNDWQLVSGPADMMLYAYEPTPGESTPSRKHVIDLREFRRGEGWKQPYSANGVPLPFEVRRGNDGYLARWLSR